MNLRVSLFHCYIKFKFHILRQILIFDNLLFRENIMVHWLCLENMVALHQIYSKYLHFKESFSVSSPINKLNGIQ